MKENANWCFIPVHPLLSMFGNVELGDRDFCAFFFFCIEICACAQWKKGGYFRFPKYSFANIHLCQKVIMSFSLDWLKNKLSFVMVFFISGVSWRGNQLIVHGLVLPGFRYFFRKFVFWGSMGYSNDIKDSILPRSFFAAKIDHWLGSWSNLITFLTIVLTVTLGH